MAKRENGLYIIEGEVNLLVTAMRRNGRRMSHGHQVHQNDDDHDALNSGFSRLRDTLNSISDISEMLSIEFLGPFLDVIRSEDTTGPVTGLALTSVNKFLSYGLIDLGCETSASAIEDVAAAVTHARFVGTDPGSDEVVLMKILHVLHTLMLTPSGSLLTNESVCEIMQSCFRICFEMRLSELLRNSAEHTLFAMVQLLFSRLPQFKEDAKWAANSRKLKMRPGGGVDPSRSGKNRKKSPKTRLVAQSDEAVSISSKEPDYVAADVIAGKSMESSTSSGHREAIPEALPPRSDEITKSSDLEGIGVHTPHAPDAILDRSTSPDTLTFESPAAEVGMTLTTTPVAGGTTGVDVREGFRDVGSANYASGKQIPPADGQTQQNELKTIGDQYVWTTSESGDKVPGTDGEEAAADRKPDDSAGVQTTEEAKTRTAPHLEFINPHGVQFASTINAYVGGSASGNFPLVPYGLPCVRELLRFLVSLTNPADGHNTDAMIHVGLGLLTVALESGADHIALFRSLLSLVRDDMCKNLFFLLKFERLSVFAASIRVCFLLFESMRSHLKLQLEMYLTKLMEIIISESLRISYEQREIALKSLIQMLRIPGLETELYLNYDCDLYCTNLFEDLTKLLSKNAFPVSGLLFSTHLLSLDALLTIIDCIEQRCRHRLPQQPRSSFADRNSEEDKIRTEYDSSNANTSASTGCYAADQMINTTDKQETGALNDGTRDLRTSKICKNRMKLSDKIPTREELAAIKVKKKIYQTGTEYFNVKPSKGVSYLQEHGLLATPLDPGEVVTFLKESPSLDKRMIGEFISIKKNSVILEAYQKYSLDYHFSRHFSRQP